MIIGHKIKIINNETVLILYLNYDNEISNDNFQFHKLSNIKEDIKKYISSHKLNLKSKKIILSCGGIVLATLVMFNNDNLVNDIDLSYVSNSIIPTSEITVVDSTDEIIVSNNNVEENLNNEVVNKKTPLSSIEKELKEENKADYINNDATNTTVLDFSQANEDDKEDNLILNEIVPEKMVTVYRSNGSVITLPLEEYLIGVVGAEMPASFSIEALKAQAIVARTYALKKIKKNEKLTDTVSTQSYKDNEQLKIMWGQSFDNYYQKIKNAVDVTKGLAIYYQNDYIDAVYHSTSNGKTEDAKEVWNNEIPYLKSVDSNWDIEATSYLRTVSMDFTNILNLLGLDYENNNLQILSRNDSGRVESIQVGNKIFKGTEFRNLLGIRSTDFDLELNDDKLIITTRGYGHGVGMSQYGANGMAKAGYNYEQILKHYYRGVSIY